MDTILHPIMVAVAWIMVQFHSLFSLFMDQESGASWTLSIVGLVIVMRIALIPLFVKQIKAARGMQMLSPELQALQKKYKGRSDPASREAMTRETMELYKRHGTNPFASCLPILAQSPIFFALFRVLINIPKVADGTYQSESIGPMTSELAHGFAEATLFGARLSDVFLQSETTSAKVVTVGLIVLMSATTFTTQRQLTQKNMPAAALEGPMAQQQKMLLYVLPLVFAVSGVNFPIGVLVYWSTTNLWSMGQQFYVIRRNPTPGSEAERLYKERRARKAAERGIVLEPDEPREPEKPKGQRQQPVRKDRAGGRPSAKGTARPGHGASGAGTASKGTEPKGPTAGSGRPSSGKSIRRADGSILRPDGSVKRRDGSIERPDGSVRRPDGSIQRADGSIRRPKRGPAGGRPGAVKPPESAGSADESTQTTDPRDEQ